MISEVHDSPRGVCSLTSPNGYALDGSLHFKFSQSLTGMRFLVVCFFDYESLDSLNTHGFLRSTLGLGLYATVRDPALAETTLLDC